MSFGGLVYYGMKYAERIKPTVSARPVVYAEPRPALLHPCPACCHVDACKNVMCGAHPNNREATK